MLNLNTELKIADLLDAPNIAENLDEQDLTSIGLWAATNFESDLRSRLEWEERMSGAMKLALQVAEEKTFPWPGASNVKFPLLTIAALQYHSRAYPALIQGPEIVKCQTFGSDPEGTLAATASLVSEHMSWQVLEQDEAWEPETDRALLVQPILGCAFKKSYFDKAQGHNVSELVLPADFVVSYWTKDLATCPRMTHIRYLFENDIREKQVLGQYLDIPNPANPEVPKALGPLDQVRRTAQGTEGDQSVTDSPSIILEQCCYMDLDGDGYKEPYVVTFRHDNSKVLRIRAQYFETGILRNGSGKIARIAREECYTKIPFIPSPDGGFYDLGFGTLLGPLSRSIDTAINQLIDAGTMKNAGGGFLGRGVRFRGGDYSFRPGEWKRTEGSSEDLSRGIIPLPVGEPSAVLFQLLSLLIQYGERVAGATEATSGENPGQNTKAGTFDGMVEQGMVIFSGIFKRTYHAFKEEFRKLYRLNQLYLNESTEFTSLRDGEAKQILSTAYASPPTAIRPAADPNYMSRRQRLQQATAVRAASLEKPLYDQLAVERYYLEALQVPGIDKLLMKELPPPSPSEKVQIEQMKMQAKMAELEAAKADSELTFRLEMLKLTEEANLNQAKILELQAKSVLLIEQAGTAKMDEEIALINAQIGMAKINHDGLLKSIDVLSKVLTKDQEKGTSHGKRTMERMASATGDPTISAALGHATP